jgi:hypothetical protein
MAFVTWEAQRAPCADEWVLFPSLLHSLFGLVPSADGFLDLFTRSPVGDIDPARGGYDVADSDAYARIPRTRPEMTIKSALHGLQDLVLGDVGRQRQVPVGIAREDVFAGLDRIIAGAGAGRLLTGFDGLHRFA